MIKHVVFDFDGTLANTKILIPKIINAVFEKHNKKALPYEEIREFMEMGAKQALRESGLKWHQVPKFVTSAQKIMNGMIDEINLYDDIKVVCFELNKNYTTNIISANTVDNITKVLDKHELKCFDHIFSTKGSTKKHKFFTKYMKKFDLSPEEILYIGDEISDVIACKKRNIKIAAVTWGYDSHKILAESEPDHILHTPLELLNVVKQYG